MPVRRLLMLGLLTGCTPASMPGGAPEPCSHAQPGPPPLPTLVRPDQLRAHDAAEHAARIGTEAALTLCAQRWDAIRR
jgi:hypothetical protein